MTNNNITTPNGTTTTSSSSEYIYIYFYTISIVGTIGNSVVALVYWHKKDKQTSTFFILVLSLSDLLVCLLLVPMTIHMEQILYETSSLIFCKAYFFLATTVIPSSSLLMTAIAFDRYFCICMVSRHIMNLRRARICVSVLIVVSVLIGVIPLIGSTVIVQHEHQLVNNQTSSIIKYNNNNNNNNSVVTISRYTCQVDSEGKYTRFGFLIMPFKWFYDFLFLACVVVITILYLLIYNKIYVSRKIKRSRKREIFYSSLLKQAENGIFPETLLLKTELVTGSGQNNKKSSSSSLFLNSCCLNSQRDPKCFMDESVNLSKTEDTYISCRDLEECCKYREKSKSLASSVEANANFLTSVKYDIVEQKIILSVINNNASPNPTTTKDDSLTELKSIKSLNKKASKVPSSISSTASSLTAGFGFRQSRSNLIQTKRTTKKKKYGARRPKKVKRSSAATKFKRDSTINSKIVPFLILIKDTRTAFILFVISILFIITYLPSIMATHGIFSNDNLYVIYLYFLNSALNPIIYSFMNKNFRSELIKFFMKKSKPIFSASRFSSFNVFSGNNNNSEMKTF